MQELRYLAQSPLISGFVADPPKSLLTEDVQGINLEVDPYWLRSYRSIFSYWADSSPGSFSYRLRKITKGHELDWDWRPSTKHWENHCRSKGFPKKARDSQNPHPVDIVILLRDTPKKGFLSEAPQNLGPHLIRYEAREACVANATSSIFPGVQVGRQAAGGSPATVGTLGGLLLDNRSGDMFALSCEHVFGGAGTTVFQPAPKAPAHSSIATVEHAVAPVPRAAGSKCNRVKQPTAVPDLAVARIVAGARSNALHPCGKVDRVTPIADMTSDDPVTFEGAASGHVQAKVASLNIWREIQIHGQMCCVGDLFTIEPKQPWYVKPGLSRGGDSGAWVLNQTAGITGWDGMLIGGDGVQAYCCFAESVYAECTKYLPSLVLP